jgi:hypothetical protein
VIVENPHPSVSTTRACARLCHSREKSCKYHIQEADLAALRFEQDFEGLWLLFEQLHKTGRVGKIGFDALRKALVAMHLPRQPGLEAVLSTATIDSLITKVKWLGIIIVEQIVSIRGIGLFL